MRWSLNNKIFCFFLPLTLLSLFFGFLVFRNLASIDFYNTHILHLKDFQLQLKILETWQERLNQNNVRVGKQEFLDEINKTKQMAEDIAAHHDNLTPSMQKQLSSFAGLSENFANAYLELFELYQQELYLPEKTAPIYEQIRMMSVSGDNISGKIESYNDLEYQALKLLSSLRSLQISSHYNQDVAAMKKHKTDVVALLAKIDSPAIKELADRAVQLVETDYFIHLAINDRKEFLNETAHYFFTVADNTIEAVISRFNEEKHNYRIIIMAAISIAILLSLLFWLAASNYFKKFIKIHNRTIESIGRGSYDYKPVGVPNDELGDLSRTIAGMAEKLKQSQTELRRSENRYRTLVENLSDGIWESDSENRINFVNEAACEILGLKAVEIIGTRLSDLIRSGEGGDSDNELRHFSEEHLSFEKTAYYKNKQGQKVILEVTAQPVYKDNQFAGFRGVIRDVSERKQLEQQLQQSQRMESVGRLAGGVAHDYNNMLSVIIGYAEMALDQVSPSQRIHTDLQEILAAAKRSMSITRQLLAFARKQEIVPQLLDINIIIDGMLKMLQRLIGENVSLEWVPCDNVWKIRMDPSQIDQILANLCVNARDAIPNVGNITISTENVTVTQSPLPEDIAFVPGEYVLLKVKDTGCGMDAGIVDNIFEPFFTTKGEMGTGLGLATIYGIVKQNNGYVQVVSEPGRGSTFSIYIPRETENFMTLPGEKMDEMPHGRGERILLVEDEASITQMVKGILKSLGYQVMATVSPNEALKIVKDSGQEYELLITDVVMPEMNGKELAQSLVSYCPDLKILYMSGYTADVIAYQGVLDTGINFIQKPFNKQDLARKVRAVLDTMD